MRRALPFLALLLAAGSAAAQVPNQTQNNPINANPINTNTNTANPRSTSGATSNSTSRGGAASANPASTASGGAASANPASTAAGGAASANPASTASSGSSSVAVTTGNTSYPANQTILSVPAIYVPSVATGNVCALGASAGASWLGAGFAVGTSWESMQCERRQTAALLFNMGTPESKAAAKEVLCNSPEIRSAYQTIGSPCARDMMVVAGPAKPTVAAAPPAPAPAAVPSFNPAKYGRASDCLTAAQSQGAALALCRGKP